MEALLGFNGLTNAADQILEETLFENIGPQKPQRDYSNQERI